MRHLFILLMLSLSANLFSFQEAVEEEYTILHLDLLKKKQNKDGSIGFREKEVLTSLGLLTFLSHGETPTSKKYGKYVKKAMQYLTELSKEIKKRDSLSVSDLYVLWAVSESYAMTGVSLLEESAETLCKHVLKHCREEFSFKQDKKNYSHVSMILSNALFAAKVSGLEYLEGVDLKPMMIRVIKDSRRKSLMNCRDKVIMRFIQIRWEIDDKEIYFCSDFKKDCTEKEKAEIAELLTKLNGNSKERKRAYKKAIDLSLEILPALVKQLNESGVVELMEVSKDIKREMKFSATLLRPYNTHEKLKNSPCDLLPASLVYFSQKGESWKLWNRLFQEDLNASQNNEGYWPEEMEVPEILNLKGRDRALFNTCYASLVFTIYYRYLSGFKMPRNHRAEEVMEEEGLDLVD